MNRRKINTFDANVKLRVILMKINIAKKFLTIDEMFVKDFLIENFNDAMTKVDEIRDEIIIKK